MSIKTGKKGRENLSENAGLHPGNTDFENRRKYRASRNYN